MNFLSERLRDEMKNTAPPFNENRHAGICNEVVRIFLRRDVLPDHEKTPHLAEVLVCCRDKGEEELVDH